MMKPLFKILFMMLITLPAFAQQDELPATIDPKVEAKSTGRAHRLHHGPVSSHAGGSGKILAYLSRVFCKEERDQARIEGDEEKSGS